MDKFRKQYRRYRNKERKQSGIILDKVLLAIIGYIALFMFYSELKFQSIVALILATATISVLVIIFVIINDIALTFYIEKQRKKLKEQMYSEKLLMLDENEYKKVVTGLLNGNGENALLIPTRLTRLPDKDMVAGWLRLAKMQGKNRLVIVTLSSEKAEPMQYEQLFGVKIEWFGINELATSLCKADPISDSEADNYFLELCQNEQKNRKPLLKNIRIEGRQKGFFSCSLVLFLMSFVMEWSVYYRVLAMLCFWLGVGAMVWRKVN